MTVEFIAKNEAMSLWRETANDPRIISESYLLKTETFLDDEDDPREVTIALLADDIDWLWACIHSTTSSVGDQADAPKKDPR